MGITRYVYSIHSRDLMRLKDILSKHRHFMSPHATILAEVSALINGRAKRTAYESCALWTTYDCRRDEWHRRDQVWAFDVGQPLPIRYDAATREQLDTMIHPEADKRGHHYWLDMNGQITNRAF